MSSATTYTLTSTSSENTFQIGEAIGARLDGGEVIELIGDLGAGKTQLTRGIAHGAGSIDEVQSPTFTLIREYKGKNVAIHHYDFYRLSEAGIVGEELTESLGDPAVVAVVEWSQVVEHVLPQSRIRISFTVTAENERQLKIESDKKLNIDKFMKK